MQELNIGQHNLKDNYAKNFSMQNILSFGDSEHKTSNISYFDSDHIFYFKYKKVALVREIAG